MLTNEQAQEIFTASGALMEGHFKLTSGRHSNRYMQCAQVLQFPEYTEDQLKKFRSGERANDPEKMMRMIADKLSDRQIKALSEYAAGLR